MALIKCPHCGKEVESSMVCSECGKVLIPKEKKKLPKFAVKSIIFFSVVLVIIGAVVAIAIIQDREQTKAMEKAFFDGEGVPIGDFVKGVEDELEGITSSSQTTKAQEAINKHSKNLYSTGELTKTQITIIKENMDIIVLEYKAKINSDVDILNKEESVTTEQSSLLDMFTQKLSDGVEQLKNEISQVLDAIEKQDGKATEEQITTFKDKLDNLFEFSAPSTNK